MDRLLLMLRAAGDPTRLRLLLLLANTELTVSEITEIMGQSQPRVSRHLKLLCDAGFLERVKEGAWVFYRGRERGQAATLAHDDDLAAEAFRLFSVRETAVGFAPAILTRAGFTGELGYEVWTTPDYLETLYEELWDAGRDLGLVHFGGRALSSLRLEKGYGSFNKDFRPDYTPGETGLDRFIDFAKPVFAGRDAALAEKAAGPKRRFVVMQLSDGDADVVGYESIMKDGAAVGYVTSGAYGHCVGASLAAGYVPAPLARDGARFEIDILGEMRTAIVRLEPLYDPQGLKLRG